MHSTWFGQTTPSTLFCDVHLSPKHHHYPGMKKTLHRLGIANLHSRYVHNAHSCGPTPVSMKKMEIKWGRNRGWFLPEKRVIKRQNLNGEVGWGEGLGEWMPPLSSGSGGWCIDINMKKFLLILEALQLIVGRLSRIKVFSYWYLHAATIYCCKNVL